MNKFDARGQLAARFSCWHRLTGPESDELVDFFVEQEPKSCKTNQQCLAGLPCVCRMAPPPAQPVQEPFGYLSISDKPIFQKEMPEIGQWETLYTTPPQRPWVELTEKEIDNFFKAVWGPKVTPTDFIRSIEQALKDKNT